MNLHFYYRALLAILVGWALFAPGDDWSSAQAQGTCWDARTQDHRPCGWNPPSGPSPAELAAAAANDRGNMFFNQKNWPAAIEAYQEALRHCPYDCDYAINNLALARRNQAAERAGAYFDRGEWDLAIANYQQALSYCRAEMKCDYLRHNIALSNRRWASQRAGWYYDNDNWDRALAAYREALGYCGPEDDCEYLRDNMTRTRFSQAMDRARRATSHDAEIAAYREALNYCHVGDNCGWLRDHMQRSEEAYVLKNALRQSEISLSRARSLVYDDRPEDRNAYFDKLLQAESEIDSTIRATRAVWGSRIKVPIDGEYREYFFEDCCRSNIRQEILSLVEALGELWHRYQYEPAREALDRIMRNWGDIDELGAPGQFMSADSFSSELRNLEANNQEAWNREMISDLSASGRSDIAINRIREMLEDNPDNYSLWRQLADLEAEQGDLIGLVETRQIIVSFSGGDSVSLNNLGAAYSRLGQYEDAIATYEQALEVNPNNLYALANLARNLAYHDPTRIEEAAALYARALAVVPDDDDLEFYEEVKQGAAALEEYRGPIKDGVRKAVWPVVNSNTARSLGAVVDTIGGAVTEGFDALVGADDPAANLGQAKLASHYGGLAVDKTGEISPRWQEFYLTDRAGEAPHFLASQVFDRGQHGNLKVGGLDRVPDVDGRPVGGVDGAMPVLPDNLAAALQNESEWINLALQERALEADLVMHVARLEALEAEAETFVDATPRAEITVQIEEARQDITNARDERAEVVRRMASFAVDFSERRSGASSQAEKGNNDREGSADATRSGDK